MEDSKEKICSICLSEIDFKLKDSQFLNCLHCFHNNCISEWFKTEEKDGSDLTCPTCRHVEKKLETTDPVSSESYIGVTDSRGLFMPPLRFIERKQNDILIGLTGLLLAHATENLFFQTTGLFKKKIREGYIRNFPVREEIREEIFNDELVATPELSFSVPSSVNILKLMGEPPTFDHR